SAAADAAGAKITDYIRAAVLGTGLPSGAGKQNLVVFVIDTALRAGLSVVPTVGDPALVVLDAVRQRWGTNLRDTASEIIAGVPADVLAARLRDSNEFAALVGNALDTATRTGYEAKRRLLGRVVIN